MLKKRVDKHVIFGDSPSILLLGTRGIPARHGGFETFVERLAPFLAERGWSVSVYCQEKGKGPVYEDRFGAVTRICVPVAGSGTWSTIIFDWISMTDALRRPGILLSFGYPTGVFAVLPRILGRKHVINMDGIEWKRTQFGWLGRASYYINERFAAAFGNRLIADHPRIADHLATRVSRLKITTIAYGADRVKEIGTNILARFGVEADKYAIVIARPEPDNSILEIVRAFSSRRRGRRLIVLGNFLDNHSYHNSIRTSASSEVLFPGAVYESQVLNALRRHARFYTHGHRVGGTNPSLVEAMGAGNAILAHENEFNRWVAGAGAVYFKTERQASSLMGDLFQDDQLVQSLRKAALTRFDTSFTWPAILAQYEAALLATALE